nr:MBL fold metallo-hydrolase [Clostridia bacterium]
LIDCCAGVCELDAVVRLITDKPVEVLVTHAHADHIGGASWFPTARLHPKELGRARAYVSVGQKLYFLNMHRYRCSSNNIRARDAFQRKFKTEFLPVNEGDVFDLGGRKIESFFTPGHTIGHMIFRDTLTGSVFAGDNVNKLVTLQYPFADSMETWVRAAERTLEIAGDGTMYGGHGNYPIVIDDVRQCIDAAKEIIAAADPAAHRPVRDTHLVNTDKKLIAKKTVGPEKLPAIVYRLDRITD